MSKIRESARGKQCLVRIPGVCNWDRETVILAHVNGAGMGTKGLDFQGAYCCSACHDVVDGRVAAPYDRAEILNFMYEGVLRTQQALYSYGLIQIKGEKR